MNKLIYKYDEVKDEIKEAVNLIADPIRQTLSPLGSNVLYEDAGGDQYVTNDGVTIAKNIFVDDPVKNAIIEVVKQPSLQANSVVGDGTTTAILLSQVIIGEGMKLLEEGMNRMHLKQKLETMGDSIKKRLGKYAQEIEGPEDILKIAKISANNDDVIASDVGRVIEVAGEDGMVFIEPHHKKDTELVEDTGFNIDAPLMTELAVDASFSVRYDDVPVLVTDKRLYYAEEAETILRVALKQGWKSVVIVAPDFIGQAPGVFIANHHKGDIRVLLVKDKDCTEKDNTSVSDLATYLGGNLVSDKLGKLVNKLTPDDFIIAKKVVSNPAKTVIVTAQPDNKGLQAKIDSIRSELDKSKDDTDLKKRLAALTNGTVTIKVGGRTPIEMQERMYRYEDAVNACRAALRDGYLVGGGLALYASFNPKDHKDEMVGVARKFCQASLTQIAENCGKHVQTVLDNVDIDNFIGYNAKEDKFENLIEAGVLDPYKVTEMAVDNSISIAIHLLTSGYLIVNDTKKDDGGKE